MVDFGNAVHQVQSDFGRVSTDIANINKTMTYSQVVSTVTESDARFSKSMKIIPRPPSQH